ncbi:MAG: glycosyltransferase [Planctomycetota bacterium]|nr:glycosyltransferase [Planctomycetota bacterium]
MGSTVEHAATRPRVALAHDWLVGLRGGEFVLDAIARAMSAWCEVGPVYTMFDSGAALTPTLDALPRVVSRVGRLPGANALRRHLLPLYPRAVADLSARLARDHARTPYDLLISTSSAAIKGLRAPEGVAHLCYCHSPARYVWSQRGAYAGAGALVRTGLRLAGPRFRAWDRATSAHVTRFLANSTHTAREIARCFGRESEVVFPPVRTGFYTPPEKDARRGEHALVVAALEPYKRTEVAIRASALGGRALRVVGEGSDAERVRRVACEVSGRVEFLGRVGDERLRAEYRAARMLLFPQIEDFGIIAVEAQACGLPVVARRAGGARDSVLDGVTGALYDGESAEAMAAAMARCPRDAGRACRENAARFGEESFAAGISAHAGRLCHPA